MVGIAFLIGWLSAGLVATALAAWLERTRRSQFREFMSAFKVWKDATTKRCRLLSSRESSDSMLFPDRAFIERVEEIAAATSPAPVPPQGREK